MLDGKNANMRDFCILGCLLLLATKAKAQSYGYQPPAMMSYQPPAMMSYQPPAMMSYQPPAMMSYQPPAMMSYQPPAMMSYQPPAMMSYQPQPQPSYQSPAPSYPPPAPSYSPAPAPTKKVYVPVYVKRPKKKNNKLKKKIISVQKGSYIAGGFQTFGKFRSLKGCQKACASSPTCFAGDYNPWLKKCYFHGNITACASMQAHPAIVHFKKVPCTVPFAPRGLVTLGALNTRGIAIKGVKSLQACIKACYSSIPNSITLANIVKQVCFAIDYNFASHKCFIHSDNTAFRICPLLAATGVAPRDRIANAAVINIAFCPNA